ncbi:FtsH protease activity modulator HflK [Phenylobacterium sp.]|uniref:FtsH protease activity modulator HflK n=1 Tax=Phenylobacterium sp. TaxID=1871053 RepID=UPI0025EC3A8E|nr:FtsH protease activity modulator HflK [Phenylobacterium sp.]MBX3483807.1 FtsH protease activity modulator HflK [Phenylobacterium sp.]MCW5760679.1 FtsH protease activity modulator HflK [Phenylobacterium sp.]
MPWNDNANPGPWGSPNNDDRRDGPKRPQGGGGPRRPGGPDFNASFDRLGRRLRDMMGGPGGPRPGVVPAIVGVVVGLWALSGIYQVAPNEVGVVTTFGAYSGQTDPGLNYHLPAPIQAVEKVPVQALNRTDVGGANGDDRAAGLMLTGDEQVVDVNFSVTWRIADPRAFLFVIRDPNESVTAVAESAMREVVGKTPLQPIISTGRGQMQQQTRDVMQKTLDAWGAGITVVEVQISRAGPPAEVNDAFRDVQSAEQDKDSSVNEANTYRNRVVNEAKGDAASITNRAQAYREQAVREAAGEAARFNQIYTEYRRAPGVTRDRLYIETMQRILQNSNKVVVDSKGASAPIILPPDVFRPKTPTVAPQQAPEPAPAPAPAQKGGQ